jgi:acetoin utilization deacetylase AcuC-like enzyme
MLNVFYSHRQVAPIVSFSPSSVKPLFVVEDWKARFGDRLDFMDFEPVTRDAFKRVHDPEMVDGILDLRMKNGFGERSQAVADSLPYTTGSLLSAAEHAVLNRTHACSPTSGFHHAHYETVYGFCTFNGIMVTAVTLHEQRLVHRVGILDCDAHKGDGTQDIIKRLGIGWIKHHTMGATFRSPADVRDLGNGRTTFTRWLEAAIDDVRDCDLILYQAGADPHVDDELGGILTTDEMRERDRMVFQGLRNRPLAWNLAGGYQTVSGATGAAQLEPILALHRQTMQEWLSAHEVV